MTALHITNVILVRPGVQTSAGSLLLSDGKIAAINPDPQRLPYACEEMDAAGALLTPGLVDIHTHGLHEYSYERDPQDLVDGTALLGRYGTTTVLPTLYKVLDSRSLAQLERLANALSRIDKVEVPGFHLEGPFLAIPGAGASTVPGDLTLLEELLSAAKYRVRAMSVSPDCPNIVPVIERLREHDIAVFITHTRASVTETQAAIAAGARHATHFYDVFPLPAETEPGVRPVGSVETLLADDRCTVDFICDGVHVDPMAIRLAIAAKGWQGVVAITDSNVGAGLAVGTYATPWGYDVKVSRCDAARVENRGHPLHGMLAGSALTMDRAVANLHNWFHAPLHETWAAGTCNPARVIGLSGKGLLEVGADADLVLWRESDDGWQPVRTWLRGTCVYALSAAPELKSSEHDQFISI